MKTIDSIPFLGGGLGYRPELHQEIIEFENEIDFLEIIAERYAYGSANSLYNLEELADKFAIIPHGLSLSIGTCQKVSKSHLEKIKKLLRITKAPYFSEHLAVTQSPGIDLGHLSPVCFNEPILKQVIENIKYSQDTLEVPLVLENITITHNVPGSTMPQEEFLHQICDATGCGLLIDITNLYTNSVNWETGLDGQLDKFPLDYAVQVHLAGGRWSGDRLIDSHSDAVPEVVLDKFKELISKTSIKGAIVERDSNFPPFAELLDEVRMIQNIMKKKLNFKGIKCLELI